MSKALTMKQLAIRTTQKTELIDITSKVRAAIDACGLKDGICMLYVPHTTAGITINESADPDVAADIRMMFDRMVPENMPYRHREGNSSAHVKATLAGASQLIAVKNGQPVLGTWQGIFFCEFDGPRTRTLHLFSVTR